MPLALFKDSDAENTSVASLMDDSLRTSRSDNDGAGGGGGSPAAATSAIDGGDGGKGSRDIASLTIDVSEPRVNLWIVCSLLTPHKRLSWSMYRVTWSVY